MSTDLPIRCSCGALRGLARGLSADAGNRVVCYCDDCQAFAHFLGCAEDLLDANGGSDIFQTSPARLEITQGLDELACVRLTSSGIFRWHTRCCSTAIANTLPTTALPFVGLLSGAMDHTASGRSRDEALGSVRMRVQGRFAKGDTSGLDAHDKFSLASFFQVARILLTARLRGDQKRNPFVDPKTGGYRVSPRILSNAELEDIKAAS